MIDGETGCAKKGNMSVHKYIINTICRPYIRMNNLQYLHYMHYHIGICSTCVCICMRTLYTSQLGRQCLKTLQDKRSSHHKLVATHVKDVSAM